MTAANHCSQDFHSRAMLVLVIQSVQIHELFLGMCHPHSHSFFQSCSRSLSLLIFHSILLALFPSLNPSRSILLTQSFAQFFTQSFLISFLLSLYCRSILIALLFAVDLTLNPCCSHSHNHSYSQSFSFSFSFSLDLILAFALALPSRSRSHSRSLSF